MEDNNSNTTDAQQSVARHLPGLLRVFTDGRVERFIGNDFVPPSINPQAPVASKDITIHPQTNVSARLFLPQTTTNHRKLPLVIYVHGGAFCVSSPFTANHHNYVSALVAEAKVVAVSVKYRLAPDHPIPAAYEDSWAALEWVASHRNKSGPEPWLNEHANFERVFLAGDSAGANIVHNLTMMAGNPNSELPMDILGACLVHPFFWGSIPVGSEALNPDMKGMMDELWAFVFPSMADYDDPRINPVGEGAGSLEWVGCRRVLVCVAEKDVLRDRGWLYYNALSRSGWMGVAEIEETEGVDHGFHLSGLGTQKTIDLIKSLALFFNRDPPPSI
ncbi:probable carboxylesterase 2 [Abrus precatorius]|uniref:Probable carboxylesterase 2 n=1 Tax=Abrus precatorius TaxID=3816 RepID=A0A8B8JQ75_ABRPR|nr:probable carboxylesterase 2 [Abrus precatorius]